MVSMKTSQKNKNKENPLIRQVEKLKVDSPKVNRASSSKLIMADSSIEARRDPVSMDIDRSKFMYSFMI